MKKYFAKYLPVEGGFQRVVKNAQGIPIDFHQEVKLFLCSRDIQVGDNTINPQGAVIPWIQEFEDLYSEGKLLKEGLFKVIGEISKNSIWIKEGDEFDEEDWTKFLVYSAIDEHGECNPKELTRKEIEWKIDYGYQYESFIRFKCPTCKIFH